MLNFDPNYNPTLGMTQYKKNNVSLVIVDGETVDLRENNEGVGFGKSNVAATNVEVANSVDVNNRYVSEFPITAGFDDSVFV